jgi:hypothetical protein
MSTRIIFTAALLAVAISALPADAAAPGSAASGSRIEAARVKAGRAQGTLLKEFNSFLDDTKKFKETVHKECHMFPEGDVIPYIMPAYAYANLALTGALPKKEAARRIGTLIELAIPGVVDFVKPPGGKLENLRTYRDNAVFLGQLNLALACYRLVGGDDRFEKTHRVISDMLYKALVESEGKQLKSYPGVVWTFDTIPVLLSLKVEDVNRKTARADAVTKKYIEWIRKFATDAKTKLPFSRTGDQGSKPHAPRGCDLSLRICMMYDLDERRAQELYRLYTSSFWLDRGIAAGFGEWPHGAAKGEDLDSGPIVMGIGMTANGFGIGATKAMKDDTRFVRLVEQLGSMQALERQLRALNPLAVKPTPTSKFIKKSDRYYTGFLFGDACLFYSITWTPLVERKKK